MTQTILKLNYLQKPTVNWFEKLPKTEEYPRHWITILDLEINLSDGTILKTPKGTIWDGASIPQWLWWLLKPIDEGAIGDFIHDWLWLNKDQELKRFNYNIYLTRLFADNERKKWRSHLASKKKFKNFITHFVIRQIGGFFYSSQVRIPK